MMLEKIKKAIYSPKLSLQEKLFVVIGITGTIAMLLVVFLAIVANDSILALICPLFGVFLMIFITVYGVKLHQTKVGGAIMLFITNVVILPISYLWGGGAYSGSPSWYVVAIVAVFIMFKGKMLIIYLALSLASFGVATYLGATHPEWVVPLEGTYTIFFDTFIGASIVSILIGIILRFTTNVYDIESKRVESQREEIEKLNEAQSQFFSSMSHEIRTPINTIIGLNEMILRDNTISEEVSENAQNIQNASKILLALINDIMDISKIQSGRMEVMPAQYETSKMFSEIVNLLWTRAKEKGLEFNVNVGESIPSMLYGDEMRLKQVIINLLTNAIKYTEKGSVTLNVDGEKTGANTFLLKIDVTDTGMGIRKENIPYLFDSFRRVEEEDTKHIEGTGLGLTISKELVELMGGTITVDSIFTKGSTFHVDIKQKILDDTPMSFNAIKHNNGEYVQYKQSFEAPDANILIVDDNDMNRMVVRKLLRSTRVKIDLAASGKECLEKTKENHYDTIFMDHEMPDMDGVETLTRVRAQSNGLCKNSPIIALTANAGNDMHDFYMRHGFQAYLAKPINGELLEATLLQFLPQDLVERTRGSSEAESFHISEVVHKKPIVITTDSLCDMPADMIKGYDIKRIPCYVVTQEGRFRDLQEIDPDNLFRYLDDYLNIDTEPASVEEYEAFFGEALMEADTVIHIATSKNINNVYENAEKAASSFGDVLVYDSENLSSGLGMVVAQAARYVAAGESPDEVIKKLDKYKRSINSSFLIPDISATYFHKRITPIATLMTKVFNMETVLKMRDGKMKLGGFRIGYVTGASHKYIRSALRGKDIDNDFIVIAYSSCSYEQLEDIKNEIKRYQDFDNVYLQKVSAVVAASAGPNAFGLFFRESSEN